jgi:predicted CopG family antitoxin
VIENTVAYTRMPGKKITPVQNAYAHLLRVKHNASYSDIAKECKI